MNAGSRFDDFAGVEQGVFAEAGSEELDSARQSHDDRELLRALPRVCSAARAIGALAVGALARTPHVTTADVRFRDTDQAQAEVGADETAAQEMIGDPAKPRVPFPALDAPPEVPVQLGVPNDRILAVQARRKRAAPPVGIWATDNGHARSITASLTAMNPRRPPTDRAVVDAKVTAKALEARAGHRPALGEFIRLTQADVWRFLAHLAGREAADDLTQETYLRAMDALPRFRGESTARAWLLAIARRTAVDRFRRESVRPPQVPADTERLAVPDASARVEIEQMLASLDPVRREALVLTQIVGFSYAEAADIVGVPIGTIRSRVARARAELVDRWSGDVDGLPDGRLAG